MKQQSLVLTLTLLSTALWSQDHMILTGRVLDANTREPLSFATIGVRNRSEETSSNSMGDFSLSVPVGFINDTLTVSYIGYKGFNKKISELQSTQVIYLEEAFTLLKEVIIAHRRLNLRDVDKSLRVIRGNLYAMNTEVTNADFNAFLSHLEEYNQTELHKKCNWDLSAYNEHEREFFRRYTLTSQPNPGKKDTVISYSRYPAVNVSFEAAGQYCEWLTEQYNSNEKRKKFKQVKFRLPTLQEWQIAALGYPRFQSWNLEENMIEVIIPNEDSVVELSRGARKMVKADMDILYPWYVAYNYRKKPSNSFHCFLGNFKVTSVYKPCPFAHPSFDGFITMGRCGAYFPNNMGFYDVVGNVAEMIDEKGKACGGSWNDPPGESTIHSVKTYTRPDASIGFRVFMEVLE